MGEPAAFAIRPATQADAAALAGLVSQLGYPTQPEQMARRLDAILARGDYRTLVAVRGDDVLGMIGGQLCPSFNRDRPSGRIAALVVDAGCRRRGVARGLLAALERWMVEAGAAGVFVNSRHHRADAHALYASAGYGDNGLRFVKDLAAAAPPRP